MLFIFSIFLYSQSNMLDNTFGTDGTVRNYITGGDSSDDEATSIAIQPDGKIVVTGITAGLSALTNLFAVARYNSNGTPDSTFGGVFKPTLSSGFILAGGDDWTAASVLIQTDGKIVVAGSADLSPNLNASINQYEFGLYRFNSNGTIDSSFGQYGEAQTSIFGGDYAADHVYAAALQGDSKIVVAGASADSNKTAFALARFNSDGTIDKSFGNNGTVRNYIASADSFDDEAHSVAIQSDGKIVAAGWSEDGYSATPQAFALARYNSNGTLDSTFGSGGTVRVAVPLPGIPNEVGLAYSVAALPDGKILAGGYCSDSGFAVVRFNGNGTIDNTFGVMGAATTNISGSNGTGDEALSMAVGSDGQIVLAGHSSVSGNGYNAFAVACFDSNGTLEKTFGTNGSTITNISGGDGSDDEANAVAIQKDGKIIAAGYSSGVPPYLGSIGWAFAIARFLPSIPTAVAAGQTIPNKYVLYQNYPNPFNPSTVISYQLSALSSVTLKVYDVLGREIETLVSQRQKAGLYQVTFNASRLSSGVYFYRIVAGNFSDTKKLLLLK